MFTEVKGVSLVETFGPRNPLEPPWGGIVKGRPPMNGKYTYTYPSGAITERGLVSCVWGSLDTKDWNRSPLKPDSRLHSQCVRRFRKICKATKRKLLWTLRRLNGGRRGETTETGSGVTRHCEEEGWKQAGRRRKGSTLQTEDVCQKGLDLLQI